MLTRAIGLDLIVATLWMALFVFGFVELLRAILNSKALSKLALGNRKPFSCNVCIAFWVLLGCVLWMTFMNNHAPESAIFVAVPSYGLSLILLRRFGKKGAAPLPE